MHSIPSRALAAIAFFCIIIHSSCDSSSPVEFDAEAAGRSTALEFTPTQIDFGSTATTASVALNNTLKRSISWTASENASWLSLGTKGGTISGRSSGKLDLSVKRGGLAAGDYSTNVVITANRGRSSEVIAVTMKVASSGTTATFTASPLGIDFGSTGTSASITLTNNGTTSLAWTASESAGWLTLGGTSGTIASKSKKTLTMSANRTGRSAGTYSVNVKVTAGTAGSATVIATMTVPSTSGTVALSGRLVDQFGGQGLSGLTVQFNGSSAQTDATGRFTLSGTPTSTASQLTLSGSGVYRRVTYAATGDALWGLVPASFDMHAYDDVAREDFGTITIRWVGPPTVYVDTDPEGFAGGSELQTWISEVRVQAAEFVSKWADQTILPQNVIVTSNPPRDYSAGTIVIHFSEDASRYGNTAAIGYARLSWSSGSITGAAVWLRYVKYSGSGGASKRRGILGHELGHAMGLGHMDGSTQVSLMAPSLGSKTDLSSYDTLVASLLYGRAPGNTAPDTDSAPGGGRGLLAPAGATAERDWVCIEGG